MKQPHYHQAKGQTSLSLAETGTAVPFRNHGFLSASFGSDVSFLFFCKHLLIFNSDGYKPFGVQAAWFLQNSLICNT